MHLYVMTEKKVRKSTVRHINCWHHSVYDPYVPPAQPIAFLSILSPARYWVSSTNHLAPRYAISSIPPLPRPS
jgi:hypothetical protein